MLALIGLIVAGWFLLTGSFVLVMRAKRLMRDGGELSLFWLVNVLPWAAVGIALDIVFNATAGTLMFFELPRQLMFTSRVKKHKNDEDWRGDIARWWQKQLNQIDPGHV